MHSLTRRSFVKSLGLGAGLASLPPLAAKEAVGAAPDVPLPQATLSEGELRFRQVHLDFHTSPLIEGVGKDFNPDEFVQVLKDAAVNSITVFAKCHHGMAYYPSKVGPVHRHLKFDLLGRMVEACHKAGIRAPIYTTVMWDEYAAEQHADWRVVDEHGKVDGAGPLEAGWRRICPNTPYLDYVTAQTEEVAKNYDADGFFIDIMHYSPYGCFCTYCMREREKLGLDSMRQEDRDKHAQMVIERAMERLSSVVWAYRPKAAMFFNGRVRVGIRPELKYFTHLEIESLPGGQWGYTHFAVMSRYVRNLGLDFMGMTGRFHRSWGDFGTVRNQAALDYECFSMLAQGGKCSIGDQLHPRGKLDRAIYDRIGCTYRSVAEKEPWCAGARAVTEIGFVSDAGFTYHGSVTPSETGVTRMLGQLRCQFDTLDWDSDFARYKLIILPDGHRLSDAAVAKLNAYLVGGGKLLLSHESGLDAAGQKFALPDLGMEYEGLAKDRGEYFEALEGLNEGIPPMVHFFYEQGSAVKALPGTTVLARIWKSYFDRNYLHFSSHRQTPFEKPTEYVAVAQRGNVIYISNPIFRTYSRHSYQVHKQLVANCIKRLLPNPLIKAEAPSTAQITITEQKGRRIVHVLHYAAERRTPDIDIVEDIIPLVNLKLALRMEQRPRQVYLAPQRQSLKVDYADGYAQVVVPTVNGHQMAVFET
jgi:hypothetical protein